MKWAFMVMVLVLSVLPVTLAHGQFLDTTQVDEPQAEEQPLPADVAAAVAELPEDQAAAIIEQAKAQQAQGEGSLLSQQSGTAVSARKKDEEITDLGMGTEVEAVDDWRAMLMQVQEETQEAQLAEAVVEEPETPEDTGNADVVEGTDTAEGQNDQGLLAEDSSAEAEDGEQTIDDIFVGDVPTDIGQDSADAAEEQLEEWVPAQSETSRIQGKSSIGSKSGIQGTSGIKKKPKI